MARQIKAIIGGTGHEVWGLSPLVSLTSIPATDPLTDWSGSSGNTFRASLFAITGTRGNDTLIGDIGNDVLYGGNGDDRLSGGEGQDTLYAGAGNDTVFGNDGIDLIFGGKGNDVLFGDTPSDGSFEPIGGSDTIYGGAGDDRIIGYQGDDLLFGGAGNDAFTGGVGNDTVYGGAGNDQTRVSHGDDDVFGGTGDDILTDGLGADDFTGGAGADSFVYLIADDVDRDQGSPTSEYGVGDDRILDFSLVEHDTLNIDLQMANNTVVVSEVVDDGTSTAFVLSYGEVITLTGFSGEDFEAGLRFESVDGINAFSQQRYGYNAIILFDFD